ncbi:MAG: T9SS type A sorting domain-containing protein [Flavobacteriales bacterium]|nr:T9SS type A sorting domain-containing protein [Flavobacteriales bacterium]
MWNTGDTSQNIYADSTAITYVTVTNISGCKAVSDTVNVMWHPLPLKPTVLVVGNDTLIYPTNLNLQWYFNSGALPGETDTLHIAQNNGDYYVQVTDSFGCKNTSDTVSIIILGIENVINNVATIYPNPTSGTINIKLKATNVTSVIIINLLGEVLLEQKVEEGVIDNLKFNISGFSEGVYYVKLKTSQKNYLQKLILLR